MNHKVKSTVMVIFLIAFLLTQGILGVNSAQKNSIELLFPVDMRISVDFQSGFTEENLAHLEKLQPHLALNTLNVLRGDNNGDLMLDRSPNRMEGAAMLVRLLGAEQEALKANYTHPFTDVARWADPYVGYLYYYRLTNGIGNNLYGSDYLIDKKSYLTFLLRVLGYSDRNGEDFTWDTVRQAAEQAGLLGAGEPINNEIPFKRLHLSEFSWKAMFKSHKIYDELLIAHLYNAGAILDDDVKTLLLKDASLLDQWLFYLPEFENAFLSHQVKITIQLNKTLAESNMKKYLNIITERSQYSTGVFVHGYLMELWQQGEQYTLCVTPYYDNSFAEDSKLFSWVNQIIDEIITTGMTEYEKEKAIHDFVVNTLQYDTSTEDLEKIQESSRSALGALETKIAVCEAYAELTLLLLKRAGIPCRLVVGTSDDGIAHVWNMVLINGNTYHVDTTWDDPVMSSGGDILTYNYFNLTDEEMKKDHTWAAMDYPRCNSETENYYVKNNLVADSPELFVAALRKAVENKETEFTLKLRGFTASDLELGKIMKDINKDNNFVLSSYKHTLGDDAQIVYPFMKLNILGK